MTHTSTEQPEALRLAYEIGANHIKVQPTEAERLRFEQWMAGHCWKVGGTWDGATYRGAAEHGDYLDPQAMHTRQLFAAWRDCAALRDQLEASQAQRAPLTDGITDTERLEHLIVADALVCEWVGVSGSSFTLKYATADLTLEGGRDTARYPSARAAIDAAITADRQRAHGITQEKQG